MVSITAATVPDALSTASNLSKPPMRQVLSTAEATTNAATTAMVLGVTRKALLQAFHVDTLLHQPSGDIEGDKAGSDVVLFG